MNWTLYAFISAIFAALVAVLGKIGLKDVDSTLATTIRAIVMAVFLIIVSISLGKFSLLSGSNPNNHISNKALYFIVLSGIAGALSWLFYFFAIKNGPASSVAAIDRTSIVFVVVLAILFLGEKFSWLKIFGALLVAGGAFLITL